MFVSIHIPKTAGTMLGYVFDFGSGRRILWDYDQGYANARTIEPRLLANLDFVRHWFWGIHGHFLYSKYAEALPDARYIACVRHPVDRVVSQYRHEIYDAVRGGLGWRAAALRSGRMGLIDFIVSDENVRCAQPVHLAGRDVADYEFLFVHEMLLPGILAFSRLFGFHRADPYVGSLPEINLGERRLFAGDEERAQYEMLSTITDSERVEAFGRMPEEVELYRQAVERAEHLIRRTG
ncbi:sulfotransferase family protein [Stella humosa]|uniref:Sulfotransferase family protein n=1 Tax=Stella humosa TaxID=94 RepID=A0A3N1LKH2_9PROT|nr:sulfotransferase family 2 domain-containing protein [Stella humosa]ROP90926.1 sulfotransferase family protein [Stella humosa]BBK34724.1 hypothetical protein STHU_53580 [Stella humosa]